MINQTTIQGIRFFNSASSCISDFEKAHWTKKTFSFIQSFGTLFNYTLNRGAFFIYRRGGSHMIPYARANSVIKAFSKKKLVVCLHGLNNNPSQFKKIIDAIPIDERSEIDIYIPSILKKGNAKLDDMIRPILEEIKKWAQGEGDKELILIGISNGGRISRAIKAELIRNGNKGNIKKIKFVSIVGACKGASIANLAHKLRLSWLMSKDISEEMPTDSIRNARLNTDLTVALANSSELKFEYTFIASPHDWLMLNYDSTLMEIPNHQARYALIKGHGHCSIVNATAKAIAEIAVS